MDGAGLPPKRATSRYNLGTKGAMIHKALPWRYPGALFTRGRRPTSCTACLPLDRVVWWEETCALLSHYQGQR